MYQIKIKNKILNTTSIEIPKGSQMIDREGNFIETAVFDENKNPLVDENGSYIMKPMINESESSLSVEVNKSSEQIESEKKQLINDKINEIQSKIDIYKIAQQHQLQHGGPGPVTDIEIMQIVNEHNGEFEVIIE